MNISFPRGAGSNSRRMKQVLRKLRSTTVGTTATARVSETTQGTVIEGATGGLTRRTIASSGPVTWG